MTKTDEYFNILLKYSPLFIDYYLKKWSMELIVSEKNRTVIVHLFLMLSRNIETSETHRIKLESGNFLLNH